MAEHRFGDDPAITGRLGLMATGPELRHASSAVIFLHGPTGSAMVWRRLMARLPEQAAGIAFDLRGRGSSFALPGPFGFRANVADIVDSMDALGIPRATFVGHSMGCLSVTLLAQQHADRVEAAVLLDGGAGPQVAADEEAIRTLMNRPAYARSGAKYRSTEEYLKIWRSHPVATDDVWNYGLADLVEYEIAGSRSAGSEVVPRILRDAVEAEVRDGVLDQTIRGAILDVRCPVELVRVDRSGTNAPTPWISRMMADEVAAANPSVAVSVVQNANPYSLVMGRSGVDACSAALTRVWSRL